MSNDNFLPFDYYLGFVNAFFLLHYKITQTQNKNENITTTQLFIHMCILNFALENESCSAKSNAILNSLDLRIFLNFRNYSKVGFVFCHN